MQSGHSESHNQFLEANAASARALGEDAELDTNLNADGDRLPLDVIAPPNTKCQRSIRGLADSLALIHLNHAPELHASVAPAGALANRLFVAMERARCEACCNPRHTGVVANMASLWSSTNGQVTRHSAAESELLPVLVGSTIRDALGISAAHIATKELHDKYLEAVANGSTNEMWGRLKHLIHDQHAFAMASRALIDELLSGEIKATTNSPLAPAADSDDESAREDAAEDDEDHAPPVDNAEDESDDDDQAITVSLREEPDDDAEAMQSENTDSGPDTVDLVNRDAPVSADSENGTDAANSTSGGYRVYTTEYDEIVDAAGFCSSAELAELRAALDVHLDRHARVVGKLSGKLQRVLMTQQQRHWMFDLDEGILDAARLARIVTDPAAALSFKQESDLMFKDTVVTVLVDNSKSMLGKPIAIAAACSDLLSQTLERCGVSVEILGFTTTELHGGRQYDQWKEQGGEFGPGRLNGLRHIIYKAADTPYRRARRCFGLMLHKDLLKQNIDGEALQWAYERLIKRPERRKILLVISDGAPIDTSTMAANHSNFLIEHLHQVITSIENRREVELIAIGIGHDVTSYYRNAMTILDARELGKSMLAKLASLFSAPQ
jgi:cobaltochelatase CobT